MVNISAKYYRRRFKRSREKLFQEKITDNKNEGKEIQYSLKVKLQGEGC